MYAVGDYVVKVNEGVCLVSEITHLQMTGISQDKLYYLLIPEKNKSSKVFVPVEGKAGELRSVVEPERFEELLKKIPSMEMEWPINSKYREQKYKEILYSGDLEKMVCCMKCMHQKRKEREAAGKRNTAVDERYMKQMEDAVYAEYAFSLGCERVEIKQKIVALF